MLQYSKLYRGQLPIGQRLALPAVPANFSTVLKQLLVTNPGGGGRRFAIPSSSAPMSVCPGPSGKIFLAICNGTASYIVEIAPYAVLSGQTNIRIVAGSPSLTGTTDSSDGLSARFGNFIGGMCYVPATGLVYIADTNNHRIRTLNATTYAVGTLAGSTSGTADGTGTGAQFAGPRDVSANPAGTVLYVSQGAAATTTSLRAVTLPGAVVTTLANSAGLTTNCLHDSLSVSADGLWIWWLSRDTSTSIVTLRRYSIAAGTSVAVGNGNASVAGTNAATEFTSMAAMGAAVSGFLLGGAGSPAGLGRVCADPMDPASCFVLEAGNSIGSSNYIRKVTLWGPIASPVGFTSSFFAGNGAATGTTEGFFGVGTLGTTTVWMGSQACDRQLLVVSGGSAGMLLAVDVADGFLSQIIGGTGVATSTLVGSSGVGHDAYLSLWVESSGGTLAALSDNEAAFRRLRVAPGETVRLELNSSHAAGDFLVAQAHNAPLVFEVSGLVVEV